MPTQADVRRIALALPETVEEPGRFAFAVMNKGKAKGFAWVWMERQTDKGPRVARPDVLAIRVAGEEAKQFLIGSAPATFFTEPHYHGFPTILTWLEAISPEQLEELLVGGWRLQAPKALVAAFDAGSR